MGPTKSDQVDAGFGPPALIMPFRLRGYDGRVSVCYAEDRDPARWGFDLLNLPFDLALAQGYPVCEARIAYAGPGYRAMMGWIQLITNRDPATGHDETSIDLFPIFGELDSPFAVFGVAPTMFDSPANPDHETEDWIADIFLAVSPDIGGTRRVAALLGFRWGYALRNRHATPLPVERIGPDAWDAHQAVLRGRFADWEFMPGFHEI
jgi:hypothetical protein